MTGYYNNNQNWGNYLFISTPEDLKKELKLKDIGKELFLLKQHAFCETCDKTLKAFGSADKARALVQKHLGFKKYAGHKAFVKEIDFGITNKCTTADIVGTKANTDRNNALRNMFYSGTISKIEQVISNHEDTIKKIQETFGFTEVENKIPDCPQELSDAYIFFSKENARGKLTVNDLENVKQYFDNTQERDTRDNPFERADMIWYYLKISGHSRFGDQVYHWDYPINYDSFVGTDKPVGDCSFCKKAIESWNDVYQEIHKHTFVHRDCLKHANEADNLESYAQRLVEKEAEEKRQEESDRKWEERKKELASQEVSTS